MPLVPFTVTNVNKWGKTTSKLYVTVGKKFQVFDEEKWGKGGLEWMKTQFRLYGRKVNSPVTTR
jgi:hypothetical protein